MPGTTRVVFNDYILKHWDNFSQFSDYLLTKKKPFYLNGEGYFYSMFKEGSETHPTPYQEVYHIFSLSGRLFASAVREDLSVKDKNTQFIGLFRFHVDLLKSDLFKAAKKDNYLTSYRKFEADVEVDCKGYDYGEEHKLMISQAGKVDLVYSHQLLTVNTGVTLKSQTYPSLKKAIHWQKMLNQINARTEKFIADKKK